MKTEPVPCTKEEIEKIIDASMDNDFYYMLFKIAKKTGRRLGEYYGEPEMRVVGTKEYIDKNGEKKIKNILKSTGRYVGGVQVKDIDYERKVMMTQVLKRRKKVYKEALLDDELIGLLKRYIKSNDLKPEDYVFRKVAYRTIQYAIASYAQKAKIPHRVSMHCVSEDTEILTSNGWKKYNEIYEGEKIFSYNLNFKVVEEDNIKKIFLYNNEGKDIYHIKNKYIDSIITPEHRIVTKFSKRISNKDIWNDYQFITIQDLMDIKSLRQIKYLLGGTNKDGISIGHYKASILGWILSDGCIDKNGDISIFQCSIANPKKCEIISKLLANSGLTYSIKIQKEKITGYNKNNGKKSRLIVFRLLKGNNKHEHDWIYQFIYKDRTPRWELLGLCGSDLKDVIDSMLLGDGSKHKIYNDYEYQGQNKKRIEFLRTASLFLNKKSSIGIKVQDNKKYSRTYISDNAQCDIIHNIKKEKYTGKVWCIETNNGNFFARRKDTLFLTGNCFRHFFITSLSKLGYSHSDIAKLTGHSTVGVISNYDHTVASDIRDRAMRDIKNI